MRDGSDRRGRPRARRREPAHCADRARRHGAYLIRAGRRLHRCRARRGLEWPPDDVHLRHRAADARAGVGGSNGRDGRRQHDRPFR